MNAEENQELDTRGPRWIQGWTHSGDSNLIHAIADSLDQRQIMGLGRMGIFARRACTVGRSSAFMRLAPTDSDRPTYTEDGWLERCNQAGRDWGEELDSEYDRRCNACERVLRTLGESGR